MVGQDGSGVLMVDGRPYLQPNLNCDNCFTQARFSWNKIKKAKLEFVLDLNQTNIFPQSIMCYKMGWARLYSDKLKISMKMNSAFSI